MEGKGDREREGRQGKKEEKGEWGLQKERETENIEGRQGYRRETGNIKER